MSNDKSTWDVKPGDSVTVKRQIGKGTIPEIAKGTLKHFSETIRINGEKTGFIDFNDGVPGYWYHISEIKPVFP